MEERISGLDLKSSEDKIVESFENYLRTKFLNFENNSQIDKKLKSYKKDLNEKFKDKIRGRIAALKKGQIFDGLRDHSMVKYVKYLTQNS